MTRRIECRDIDRFPLKETQDACRAISEASKREVVMTASIKQYPAKGQLPESQEEVIIHDSMFGVMRGKMVKSAFNTWFTLDVTTDSWSLFNEHDSHDAPEWWIPMPVDDTQQQTTGPYDTKE